MREAASELLVERARADDGLRRTLLASSGVHLLAVATLLLAPDGWFSLPRTMPSM